MTTDTWSPLTPPFTRTGRSDPAWLWHGDGPAVAAPAATARTPGLRPCRPGWGGAPDPDDLARVPLFAGIGHADLLRLRAYLVRLDVPAGRVLLAPEQPGEAAYAVLSGTLRVDLADAAGGEVTVALLGPGELVGTLAMADDGEHARALVALEPVTLLRIDRAAFASARRETPILVDNLIWLLLRQQRRTDAQLLAFATLDVAGRVARQLRLLAADYGVPAPGGGVRIELRLTQDDLARLVGATRVRVNQALGTLRRDGIVAIDARRRFVVHGREALTERA